MTAMIATLIIAILALLTSIMLLIVHYKNQVERRHGEIVQLRSDLLRRAALTHQRLISVQLYFETARIKLREIADCNGKFEAIEKMPDLIADAQKTVQRQALIKDKLEGIDTIKFNKSKNLLFLQSLQTDIQTLEDNASGLEQNALELLRWIRSAQERK
jgi:hypothetical protein